MTEVINSRKLNLYLHEYRCYINIMYTIHETKKTSSKQKYLENQKIQDQICNSVAKIKR